MSGHGRGTSSTWLAVAEQMDRRIASPDRAGAIAEFSHTRRPPHGYAVVLSRAWCVGSFERSRARWFCVAPPAFADVLLVLAQEQS